MADPIQDSDLAKRNADERALTLGAMNNPEGTKMPDGRMVAEYQAATYQEHLAEGRAAEALQTQRMREQSIANDPFYQGESIAETPIVSAEMVESARKQGRTAVTKTAPDAGKKDDASI
jgi:hypothetical protein